MSRRARRFLYVFAFGVFFLIAPLVVAYTAGYRWAGWPTILVRTGVISITSQPRASVWLNGQLVGLTPRRLNGLTPGTYRLELRRDGYGTWQQYVAISANAAQVIGPVYLYPSTFDRQVFDRQAWTGGLATTNQQAVIGWRLGERPDQNIVKILWPSSRTLAFHPTDAPRALEISPDEQLLVWQYPNGQMAVISLKDNRQPWLIDEASALQWSSTSNLVFYGQRQDQLIRFDALTQTTGLIGPASSFVVLGQTIWTTTVENSLTTLWRQQTSDSTAEKVDQLDGQWQLVPNQAANLVLRRTDGQQAFWYTFTAVVAAPSKRALGPLDRLFWDRRTTPPLFVSGVTLNSLVKSQASVIERTPASYLMATWIVPEQVFLTANEQTVQLQSIGPKQGRATLLIQSLAPGEHWLALDAANQRFLTWSDQTGLVTAYRWSPAK